MSTKISIEYNPYYVSTKISINGKVQTEGSDYYEMSNGTKRLQDWIDEFVETLHASSTVLNWEVLFIGTALDFEDVEKAASDCEEKYKSDDLSIKVTLEEKTSREGKLEAMNELWANAKNSPVPAFNSSKIQEAFERSFANAFEINVIATMSSGKSTLINALLGTDLLPSANEATTATIARIENDISKPECVFYGCRFDKNGDLLDDWRDVNEWRKDPEDRIITRWNRDKNTSEIFISGHIPALSEKDGTKYVFIDTPGPNSNDNKEHKDITYGAIHGKNPSMILYVFDGTHQCTDDDHSVLTLVSEEMKRNGRAAKDRFIFVANKMDALNPRKESIAKALVRWKNYLEEKFGIINPVIIPIAAEFAKFLRITKNYGDGVLDEYERPKFIAYKQVFESPVLNINMLQYVKNSINSRCYGRIERSLNETQNDFERLLIKTGIPTLEALLNDFMEKHVIPSKLKDGVDCLNEVLKEEAIVENEIKLYQSSQSDLQKACEKLAEFKKAKDEADKGCGIKRQIEACVYTRSIATNQKLNILYQKKQELQNELENLPETMNENSVRQKFPAFCKKGEVLCQQMHQDLSDALEAEYLEKLQTWEKEYEEYIQNLLNRVWTDCDFPALKELQKQTLSLPSADRIIREKSSGKTTITRHRKRSVGERFWGMFALENPFRAYDSYSETLKTVKSEVFIAEIIVKLEQFLDRAMADFDTKAAETLRDAKTVVLEKIKQIDDIFAERCKQLEQAAQDENIAKEKATEAQKRYDWIKDFEPKLNTILDLEES